MDKLIKDTLMKDINSIKLEKSSKCPSETELIRYLEDSSINQSLKEHVADCYYCIEQLDQAQRARSITDTPPKKKGTKWLKKNIWLIGAGVTFLISFAVPRYFLQFLILTLLMGIKWIFSGGSTKTVVMIYDALKRKNKEETHSRL